jgi:hypothetical protein
VAQFEDFFRAIDRRWGGEGPRIQLRIIGSAALLLQTDYRRGTKDSDVLETLDLNDETKTRLLAVAGKNSDVHVRQRLYLEIVPSGLPFLAQVPRWHPLSELNQSLRCFDLVVLDVVDVVVSKLKRFSPNDASDIAAMVDRGLVIHGDLIRQFRSAVDAYSMDARAPDLPKYVTRLHQVERDLLSVDETEIELPGWI